MTRSGLTRVVPDVLADDLLEREAAVGGHATGFTEELWAAFGSTQGERLVITLARWTGGSCARPARRSSARCGRPCASNSAAPTTASCMTSWGGLARLPSRSRTRSLKCSRRSASGSTAAPPTTPSFTPPSLRRSGSRCSGTRRAGRASRFRQRDAALPGPRADRRRGRPKAAAGVVRPVRRICARATRNGSRRALVAATPGRPTAPPGTGKRRAGAR